MGKCFNCNKEYYVWEQDKGTPFELFCSDACIKDHEKMLENQDWPRDPALKYKVAVGEIACPHCGTVQHGVLHPICPFCDKLYWKKEQMDEKNNPFVYDNDSNSSL